MSSPVLYCPECRQGPSFYQRREDGLVVSDRTTGAHFRYDERGIVASPCPGTPIDLVAVYEAARKFKSASTYYQYGDGPAEGLHRAELALFEALGKA